MKSARLEAFSDGVLAIVITIMVLEMKTPEEPTWEALAEVLPIFISYLISFIYIGIYWNNHHHMLHIMERVNGKALWANLHLLFWLSLVPFATAWLGEYHAQTLPVVLYGFILLMAAIAYRILEVQLIKTNSSNQVLAKELNIGRKEYVSTGIYTLAIPLAFLNVWIAMACYILVAIIWVIPDKRVERTFKE